jgi:hypothetical protein
VIESLNCPGMENNLICTVHFIKIVHPRITGGTNTYASLLFFGPRKPIDDIIIAPFHVRKKMEFQVWLFSWKTL